MIYILDRDKEKWLEIFHKLSGLQRHSVKRSITIQGFSVRKCGPYLYVHPNQDLYTSGNIHYKYPNRILFVYTPTYFSKDYGF